MNYRQEHVNPHPPFLPAPMPRNAAEERFLLLLLIVVWAVGLALTLWIELRRRK
jgi:hypothetical protein